MGLPIRIRQRYLGPRMTHHTTVREVNSPHTVRVPYVRCTVRSRAFFFRKIIAGAICLFFPQKKMRKSLVSRVKRVKSDD